MCVCLLKVQDGVGNSSQADAKLGVEDHDAETTSKSAECDRSLTLMQSSESLIPAEGPSGSKSPGVRDVCEPAMKADRHIADMSTLTVDDMV